MPKNKYDISDIALEIVTHGPAVTYVAKASGEYEALFISPNIETQLGYTPEEFLSAPDFWVNNIHADDKERILNKLGNLFDTGYHKHEYRFKHKDGSYRWMHDELTLVKDDIGNPVEIFGFWKDISDRKETEEALIEATKAKSLFLSRMSHELRTPLNSILGFAQLIEYKDNSHLDAVDKESVTQIINGGRHLLNMVNDLLELSIIEADKLELNIETVDVHKCIQDCTALMQPQAKQRDISLLSQLADCPSKNVRADPIRLKQVLLNLISNAVKYNRQGGKVTLSCEQIAPGTVRVNVNDTGVGIAKADMDNLFEPFSRIYLESHATEGSGIGLNIAKHLIEEMGGSIGFTTELDIGSTFWIELQES